MTKTMYNYDEGNKLFTEYKNFKFFVGINNKLSTENLIREINKSDFIRVVTVQPSLDRIIVRHDLIGEYNADSKRDGVLSSVIYYVDTKTNKVLPTIDISEYRYDNVLDRYYELYTGEIKVDLEEYAVQVK